MFRQHKFNLYSKEQFAKLTPHLQDFVQIVDGAFCKTFKAFLIKSWKLHWQILCAVAMATVLLPGQVCAELMFPPFFS